MAHVQEGAYRYIEIAAALKAEAGVDAHTVNKGLAAAAIDLHHHGGVEPRTDGTSPGSHLAFHHHLLDLGD